MFQAINPYANVATTPNVVQLLQVVPHQLQQLQQLEYARHHQLQQIQQLIQQIAYQLQVSAPFQSPQQTLGTLGQPISGQPFQTVGPGFAPLLSTPFHVM